MDARAAITLCLAVAVSTIGLASTVGSARAGTDCECIGNGKRISEGAVVCLQVSASMRYLARCERNLNNTSWKKVQDGCPVASMGEPTATRVQQVTPVSAPLL